ncbi:FIT family protein scs3 [Hypsizygus marmoreus]|uniref:FIT family protein scs3 n=1 Tax=Hypsizygus marmoreus TaxID=39966 RepID=A0A369JV64_HYPMA|nr:FIT family protein scs3 [Hypsizygus marmoreus]
MPDIRLAVLAVLTAIIVSATTYSIVFETYLDTSNPLLTHLPHPLGLTHYYANKSNILNVYFIKKAWAWTTGAFLLLWFTSPPSIRIAQRWWKWAIATAMWLVFTSWFFGPALLERLNLASGGECILALPSGDSISVPVDYCLTKSSVSPGSHPQLFVAPFSDAFVPPLDWRSIPRLRRGHDVSGHLFLLTMSALFLADQLRYSFRARERSTWHSLAVVANVSLIGVWLFACYTTSLYFHSPLEKLTGYILGISGFAVTLLPENLGSPQTNENKLHTT